MGLKKVYFIIPLFLTSSSGATTLSIMTFSIMGLVKTLSSIDIQHNSVECHYAECRYAACRYADCRDYLNVIPSDDMMSVVMLNVVMLSVVMLNVVMLSVVMLIVVMLCVVAPIEPLATW